MIMMEVFLMETMINIMMKVLVVVLMVISISMIMIDDGVVDGSDDDN
jgi:hypothetical protein